MGAKLWKLMPLALCMAIGLVSLKAAQAEYPERPIEIIIMSKEGGGQDLASRMIGDVVAKHLGATIKYTNRPGASGRIALETFLAAEADGHTLLAPNIETITIMYGLNQDKLGFAWDDEVEWLGAHLVDPGVLITPAGRPWADIGAFIDTAKQEKVRIGVPNWASAETLALLQLQEQTGAQFEIIPYSGGKKALTAILGDQIEAGLLKYAVTRKAADEIRYLGIFQDENTVDKDAAGLVPVNQSLGTEVANVASLRSLAIHASLKTEHPDRHQMLHDAYAAALADPGLAEHAKEMGLKPNQLIAWDSDKAKAAAASTLSGIEEHRVMFEEKSK